MKPFKYIALILFCTFVFILGIGNDVAAAETGDGWRATYDLVLRWVNFIILGVLLFKFGKTPMKDFLTGQKEKLSREVRRREKEKEAAIRETEEIRRTLDESEIRFANIKDRIIEQGEKKKYQIIEDAKEQSRLLMEEAKRRIDSQILQAKEQFKAELVEAAIELAIERIPREITEEDDQKYIDRFLASTVAK